MAGDRSGRDGGSESAAGDPDTAQVETELSRDMTLFDITFIGAAGEGLLKQLVFGAIPEAVGRRAESTVIMAKRDLGITSWVTRWFRSP